MVEENKAKVVERQDLIEEFFNQKEQNIIGISTKQLFSVEDDIDLDLKTETDIEEISIIERLYYLDTILVDMGLEPLYKPLYIKRLRLKISKDRGSRKEFVKINTKGEDTEETLSKFGNLSNILGVRK